MKNEDMLHTSAWKCILILQIPRLHVVTNNQQAAIVRVISVRNLRIVQYSALKTAFII